MLLRFITFCQVIEFLLWSAKTPKPQNPEGVGMKEYMVRIVVRLTDFAR